MYEVKVCVCDVFKQNNQVIAIELGVFCDRFHALPPCPHYFLGSIAEVDKKLYRHGGHMLRCEENGYIEQCKLRSWNATCF